MSQLGKLLDKMKMEQSHGMSNPYKKGSTLYGEFEKRRETAKSTGSLLNQFSPQETQSLSGAGKIKPTAGTRSQSDSTMGQQVVSGGQNMYGFDRPDTYLMRDGKNNLLEPFKETVGESTAKLREYGNTFGSDVDGRAKVGMGDAYGKLKQNAMGTGDMEEIAIARQQANNQSLTDAGKLNRQNANNMLAMQSQMAMRGGLGGGASERMARGSMRNQLMGQQGIASQNRDANLNLSLQNANMRQSLLQDVGRVEQGNQQYNANAFTNNQNRQLDALNRASGVEQDVQRSNIGALRGDVDKQNMAAHNLYGEDMALYGAKMTADGQVKAAKKSGGGGCCFIFLEARYGNGTMDEVVRRFRDEHMTDKNKRGYYKMSEVLVPLMRKHKLVKLVVRALMTDPMVSYGKAYYGANKLGFIFKPVVKFWLNTFDFLGTDHEFVRENGETV
jgi:hypothetical protein